MIVSLKTKIKILNFDGAISVDVTFYMKAPLNLSKEPSKRAKQATKEKYQDYINELIRHPKKPDLDNLIKAVFDSVSRSEIVWKDDNLICDVKAKKLYSPNPRIEIEIEEVENVI
ncbi:crossover junction endodeoxyribonuclease RusA [Streptococcus pseudoporcinus]|uniref:Crossover junction endodeoxyribonuclease RusA n=1 Tax=Streptococcus pseudoporcinus TaxID=361101 RepID=A0A4U9XN27_9STRE|nr:RusA family crossover junction endodeoxyribonuclease [Streptococcus pseudoporcinus]VTS14804.1 crossover junction endodeoxyribonuclease RusA [Streptococcus pseudoporcinus]